MFKVGTSLFYGRFFLAIAVLLLCLPFSCTEKEEFPIEPVIGFVSLEKISNNSGYDDKATLVLSFTDGDGDIGLSEEDTAGDYAYNLYVNYFEKQNGQFIHVQPTQKIGDSDKYDTTRFDARIPIVTPPGNNKAIKGEVTAEIFCNNFFSQYDTILYEVYLVDRALHISNTIRTSELIINK